MCAHVSLSPLEFYLWEISETNVGDEFLWKQFPFASSRHLDILPTYNHQTNFLT